MTARGFSDSGLDVHPLTAPVDLDDATEVGRTLHTGCPPCTGDCEQGRSCTSRVAYYGAISREEHYEALDRHARIAERGIYVLAVLLIGSFVVGRYWPELARWLP